jgi:aryl carrier-like protein
MEGLCMPDAGSSYGDFQKIFDSLKELLRDINEDWEGDEVTPQTRLVDLGMESISLVYLIAELQQMYGLGDTLFRKMREEGTFLKDMTVGDVLNSLSALIEAMPASKKAG